MARAAPTSTRATFVQALIGDVLNVKAASVYLTLAPQFVTDRHDVMLAMLTLATIHAAVSTVWLVAWSHVLRRGGRRLDTPRARAIIDRVAGWVLIGLGVRAASSART